MRTRSTNGSGLGGGDTPQLSRTAKARLSRQRSVSIGAAPQKSVRTSSSRSRYSPPGSPGNIASADQGTSASVHALQTARSTLMRTMGGAGSGFISGPGNSSSPAKR